MARKTIVDKTAQTVGVGIAMASDVGGAIKTAFDGAMAAVTEVLKKEPAGKGAVKAATKPAARKPLKKGLAKKVPPKTAAKKTVPKRAVKKSVKKPAKKAGRSQR